MNPFNISADQYHQYVTDREFDSVLTIDIFDLGLLRLDWMPKSSFRYTWHMNVATETNTFNIIFEISDYSINHGNLPSGRFAVITAYSIIYNGIHVRREAHPRYITHNTIRFLSQVKYLTDDVNSKMFHLLECDLAAICVHKAVFGTTTGITSKTAVTSVDVPTWISTFILNIDYLMRKYQDRKINNLNKSNVAGYVFQNGPFEYDGVNFLLSFKDEYQIAIYESDFSRFVHSITNKFIHKNELNFSTEMADMKCTIHHQITIIDGTITAISEGKIGDAAD